MTFGYGRAYWNLPVAIKIELTLGHRMRLQRPANHRTSGRERITSLEVWLEEKYSK